MTVRMCIKGSLPGLNEYTRANRGNRYGGNKAKQDAEAHVMWFLPKERVTEYPVIVSIDWYEKDERRDPDNVMFAVKFILDALVKTGILLGDRRKHIAGIRHEVYTDPRRPRIEVAIAPAGDRA